MKENGRDWRIYRDYAELLIQEARQLYGHNLPVDLPFSITLLCLEISMA